MGRPGPPRSRAPVAFLAALLPACAPPSREGGAPAPVPDNLSRPAYAGSQACASCHASLYAGFMASPMHNMTRLAGAAGPGAPFDGRAFRFQGDSAVLEWRDGERRMRVGSSRFGDHNYRVTKLIGGHHRLDFAGVEAGEPDPGLHAERVLPVSYMLATGKLRYKGYSVMDPERPGLKAGAVWDRTCMFCHNTVPYLSTILGDLAGPGAPAYQGGTVDRWLPGDRRLDWRITDTAGYRRALAAELARLGVPPPAPEAAAPSLARAALAATRERFGQEALVEIGIGCEACHGGSLEHARDPRRWRPSLWPRSPWLRADAPPADSARARSREITRTCARCHQVLFSRYPWTWEGKRRRDPEPGGAHINSGEGRDLLLGNCAVACTDCHDPHAPDGSARLARLDGPAGNGICLACHGEYRAPAALRAHAHHDPAGPGGLCLNCHMPRKNMSLDTRLTRYHRIGSPDDRAKVEGDRPLECALCHGERRVEYLVDTMEAWWGKRYDRGALRALYGDLGQGALAATLRRGKPHEKAVALYLAGRRRERDLIDDMQKELADPYPLVRYYADEALAATAGETSPLDLHRPAPEVLRAAAAWLKRSAGPPAPAPPDSAGEAED